MDISGQKAMVTGGASGLGAATARHLAAQGAEVTILDYDGDKAAAVAGDIGGLGLACDVRDEEEVVKCLAASLTHFGQAPRIVVNCAGIAAGARVVGREGKLSIDLFRQVVEVNLLGSYHVMSHFAKEMMALPPLETG